MRWTASSRLVAVVSLLTSVACGDDDAAAIDGGAIIDGGVPAADAGECKPGTDAGGGEPGDVTGTWAVLQLSTAVSTAFNSAQISRNVHLYVMTQNATGEGGVSVVDQLCDLQVDGEPPIEQHTRLLPKAIASVLPVDRLATVMPDKGGVAFFTSKGYTTRGWRPTSAATDPMPEAAAGTFDGDEDGNPGITLILDGLLRGQIYVVQRDWNAYSGRQIDANNIVATADWAGEQKAYGAKPESLLEIDLSVTRAPDDAKHPVIMVRIPDGSDCAYVLANQCQLFGGK
jgi:hypothetical protein